MHNYHNFLRDINFFSTLPDSEILKIETMCREEYYKAGDIVFKEGTIGDKFYIIMEGAVEIWKDYNCTEQDRLAVLGKGEMFGEIALIDNLPRSATIITRESLTLLSIDHNEFKQILTDNHAVSLSIMKSISAMIRSSNENFVQGLRAKNQNLKKALYELEQKADEREQIDKELKKYQDHLETLVKEKTSELLESNQKLKREIDDRNKAEQALRESEEKYRLLFENANDAIFIIQDQEIKFSNTKTENIGKSLSIALDKEPFMNFIHSEDWEIVKNHLIKKDSHKKLPFTCSFRLINTPGEYIWVELNTAFISWNEKPATLNFLRDITTEKKLEEQFHHSQRMEALGTLAGGTAHNFNNLLQVIQGNVSFILLDADTNHPHYDEMKSIEEAVESGANLSRQLLGFARAGKHIVKPADINDIITNTSQMFSRTCKEVKIHKSLRKDVPAVEVDLNQIELVLLNIYINARQAMVQGGDLYLHTDTIYMNEYHLNQTDLVSGIYVKISITDTGIGMDANIREKIFEPFFTTKEEGIGTGLGLSSAYGIIKQHGGFISCSSSKDVGTCFEIYLPASDKKLTDPLTEAENLIEGSETILLVDDEETIIKIGKLMLKSMGYNVLCARGGRAAIDIFEKHFNSIDMVILDIIMPDMDGGKVFDLLKKIRPGVKVLLSSGYRIDGQAASILDRGCDGFIQKPFNIKQLSREIQKILNPLIMTKSLAPLL